MGMPPPLESERSVLIWYGLPLVRWATFFPLKLVLVVASLCECSFNRTELYPGSFMGNEKMMIVETKSQALNRIFGYALDECFNLILKRYLHFFHLIECSVL